MSKLNGTQRIYAVGILCQFIDSAKKAIKDNDDKDTKEAMKYLLIKLSEIYAELFMEALGEVKEKIKKIEEGLELE